MNYHDRERKIRALRNLAERPGTEAEGKVAHEMLSKLEPKVKTPTSEEIAAYGNPSDFEFNPYFGDDDTAAFFAETMAAMGREARQRQARMIFSLFHQMSGEPTKRR